jgi:nucleotide-binding universal stress UspA family protein
MFKVNRILAALDFSKFSPAVVEAAADLAKRYDAALTLLHVVDEPNRFFPEGFIPTATTPENLMNLVEMALADAKQDAVQAGVRRVSTAILKGVPFVEIVSTAQAGAFDVVVMATHGRTGVAHAIMGSVAERVARKAPCSVLVVRGPTQS